MKRQFILLLVCWTTLCGCSRKDQSASEAGPQPTPEQAAQIEAEYVLPASQPAAAAPGSPQPAPQQPQPAQSVAVAQQPIQQRLSGAIHAKLTIQLRQYIEKNGQMPGSFAEFANSAMDSAPAAPDGMKFVIDPADRTVKAVKK